MGDPTRWSDPRGDAPPGIQGMLAAAKGAPPPIPEAVQSASRIAVAGLGGATTAGWWTALKVVGALSAAGVVGVSASHRNPRPSLVSHRAAPSPTPPALPLRSEPPAPAVPEPVSPPVVPVVTPVAVVHPTVAAETRREREAEAALLERARRLIASGDTALAIAMLRDHARRYPRSALSEERDYLTLRVHAREATPVGVEREARRFLRLHPDGIYSSQVRAMLRSNE